MKRSSRILTTVLVALVLPLGVSAQDELVPDEAPEEVVKEQGWDYVVSPGLSFSFGNSQKVIGQADGSTVALSVTIGSGANYRTGPHELRNTLNITEAFSRTPVLEEFVKSTDTLKYEGVYLFHLLDWLGPYARLSLETAIFESFDVQPSTVQWIVTDADGNVETPIGRRLRLTDGFNPFTLRESAGFFATAYDTGPLKIEARLGFGGLHVFADDQFAVTDDGDTDQIEVSELKSFNQAGGEFGLTLGGALYEKKVTYSFGADVMMPFVNELEEGDDRSVTELTNIELNGKISFKLLSWLSVDYVLKAIRQPQLLDEFQVQNNLLVTASYTFAPEKEEAEKKAE
jgi:hypothetical protein